MPNKVAGIDVHKKVLMVVVVDRATPDAVWAVAHRLCRLVWKILHEGVRYIEQGTDYEPKLLIHRARYLAKQLRKFGYDLRVTATTPAPA